MNPAFVPEPASQASALLGLPFMFYSSAAKQRLCKQSED